MLTVWSLVSLPFLNPACTSGSSQFTYCWCLAWMSLSIILLAHEMSKSVWLNTEVNAFLKFSCFFYDPVDVGNLISGSSAFSKSSLYIWKFSVHVLLMPSLKDFEHYLISMWDERAYMVVWTFFGTVLLWNWNENSSFPVLWPLPSFPRLLAYWVQHFNSIIF